ncbi:MAG: hypothetical protein ACLRWP_08880 [Bilophila wadsworthia]
MWWGLRFGSRRSASSALSGAVAFVSDRFPSLGAAAEAVGQGRQRAPEHPRSVASVFSGSFRRAGCGARAVLASGKWLSPFSALGKLCSACSPRVGTGHGVLPDWRVGGKPASAVAGRSARPSAGCGKAYGLVDMLPDWALEKLGWKRSWMRARRTVCLIPHSYAHGGWAPPRERRFRIRRPFLRNAWGGFRCGRFLRRRL